MRISDWSSDVCSSDLLIARLFAVGLLLRDKFTQHATSAHRASIASIASQEHRPHGHDVPIADLRLLESDHRLVLFLERIFYAGAQFCGELLIVRMDVAPESPDIIGSTEELRVGKKC